MPTILARLHVLSLASAATVFVRETLWGILSLSLSLFWRTLIRQCARALPSSNVRAKSNESQFSSARQLLPSDGENLGGREERRSELIQVRYLAVVSVE